MTPAELLTSIARIAEREMAKIENLSKNDEGLLPAEHVETLLKLSKIARAALGADDDEDPRFRGVDAEDVESALRLLGG